MPFPEDEKKRKKRKKGVDNWWKEWYSNKAVRSGG